VLGEPDLLAAELRQGQISHLEIDAVAHVGGQPLFSRRHGVSFSARLGAQLLSLVTH
jgi:hypothetical protein